MIHGQIRWYTFRPPDKRRPVLILTRTIALSFLQNVTIAPLTTNIRNIPTEVLLTPEDDGVFSLSVINVDNIQTVPQDKIGSLITTLSPVRLDEVNRAILFALGMDQLL